MNTEASRPIDRLLAEYAESHRNSTNKTLHWIAVPVIVVTIAAMLWSLPVPGAFALIPCFNWATIISALAFFYYVSLSPALALGFAFLMLPVFALIAFSPNWLNFPLWIAATVIFVLAWALQFVGHHIEGKKPSFLKDLQFLLIGPVWLLHFAYRRFSLQY